MIEQRLGVTLNLIIIVISDITLVWAGFGKILLPTALTKFYLISKGDPLIFTLLSQNVSQTPGWISPTSSNLEPKPLALMLHGFGGETNSTSNVLIGKALLENYENLNLVAVDYSNAVRSDYLKAVSNVLPIAKQVASWLRELIYDGHATPENVTLIGFSLGAQVAGISGHLLQSYNLTIGKIVALDPALPSFDSVIDEERLTQDDADHVVVIHTTGGNLAFADPLGDIDFYPNGGTDPQPMCLSSRMSSISCSHSAAYKYIADSIANGGFEATKCDDWIEFEKGKCDENPKIYMSIDVDKSAEGKYYLRTRSNPPYGDKLMVTEKVQNLAAPTDMPVRPVTDTKGAAQSPAGFNYLNMLLIAVLWLIIS